MKCIFDMTDDLFVCNHYLNFVVLLEIIVKSVGRISYLYCTGHSLPNLVICIFIFGLIDFQHLIIFISIVLQSQYWSTTQS